MSDAYILFRPSSAGQGNLARTCTAPHRILFPCRGGLDSDLNRPRLALAISELFSPSGFATISALFDLRHLTSCLHFFSCNKCHAAPLVSGTRRLVASAALFGVPIFRPSHSPKASSFSSFIIITYPSRRKRASRTEINRSSPHLIMDATNLLDPRLIGSRCPSGYSYRNGYCYRNSWYSWGRWVLVGVLIFFALVFLFLCSCCARRRSRKGSKPMYGTGWMGGNKWGGNNNNNAQNTYPQQTYPQQDYNQNQGGYNYNQQQQGYQAPPNYGNNSQQPQNTGTTMNPNDGYYGNQQYGGPQQPQNTYQPAGGYAPPPGPPPTK
ncbi:hypothetical protein CCM_02204 [Cordyceps militaris CM01]|uniref:Uncharacterized protein n=1 Tax=Cordyceps militaris (strain CM01) TaxID=983644 RepID=G3J8E4_CORMM|nr:uncharacterized protein CCM_02204 [Cordyceps militaris CM01]EGX93933.1 hypothetical protein CCM_02204 [Cordyceps militaris CM01]